MIQDAALQALGLDENASPEQIAEAIAHKRAQLEQASEKAPTDALRNKYQQQLQNLQKLEDELVPRQKPAAHKTPPLSQTKLADLPQSATQFDGGHSAQVNLQPGQTLANRYEIKEQIGAGGMGAVYRALDKTTGKEIALKVLLPALLKNERARERLLDEARISQQLSHPNIVNVFDVQQDGDFFFLTMELLQGQDLRQVMENRKLARQPFDVGEVLEILDPLCEALAYAHEFTVHRDIKPENIWLSEDGKLKIMDFGIAQVQSTSQRTQTGAAMGTAYYMAPEQLKGQKDIDGRADLYALAVMAYELLSGEVPAGMVEPLQNQRKGISKKLAQVIHQGLSAKPENRFADIQAFRQALQQAAGGRGLSLPPLPWKNLGIAAGVLVALLGLGGLAASDGFDLGSLKSLLPMSKEEMAAQKAGLAKIQGEIKVLKQRLDNQRRSLDSDLRDAERNNGSDLKALQHWQRLTEDAIFAGSQLTELEGNLAMAEALLRDNAFAQAQPVFAQVRAGYAGLLQQFEAAGRLYQAERAFEAERSKWQALKKDYGLQDPAAVAEALRERGEAQRQQRSGEFSEALGSWQQSAEHWQAARLAVKVQTARIDGERQAQAAAEAKRGREAEAQAAAAEVNRRREAKRLATEQRAAAERARIAKLVEQALPPMVRIPGGSFMMGSSSGKDYEKPVHRVTVKPFAMSKYEVTFTQYDAFAQATGRAKPDDEGWGRGSRPVIIVSWEDAIAYAQWLSKQSGKHFRLPTEAEWEYAARAGSTTKYSWGDSIGCSRARYGVSLSDMCGENSITVPVGSYAANKFGLYDMHGNVWEWVQDCWHNNYSGAPANGSVWTGGDCGKRVVRGGSLHFNPESLRSAARAWASPSYRSYVLDYGYGIRLAQDL